MAGRIGPPPSTPRPRPGHTFAERVEEVGGVVAPIGVGGTDEAIVPRTVLGLLRPLRVTGPAPHLVAVPLGEVTRPVDHEAPAQGKRKLPPCLPPHVAALDLREGVYPAAGVAPLRLGLLDDVSGL